MKETENDTNKWKDIPWSWIEELILLKFPYYPKQSTDSMQSLSKFQWNFSQKQDNPKICVEPQQTPNSQSNLEKE